jgi:hypothetical protein
MGKRRKSSRPERTAAGEGKGPRIIKWVGSATAVLSLGFGLQQVAQLVSEVRERQRKSAELHSIAKLQQESGDYQAAWTTYERALEAAEPGGQLAKLTGQLGGERRVLREAQEDLATEWIANLSVNTSRGETFSGFMEKLDPVLNRGVANSTGVRKADLLAHAGWATFLKWRDGKWNLNPEQQYKHALQIDPRNPYAHAYLAHWQLFTRRKATMTEAKNHFVEALASGRARSRVRHFQLAAMRNLSSDGEAEFIAVVNDMRKNKEPVDPRTRDDLYSIYSFACSLRYDPEKFARFSEAAPIGEQLATFQELFFGPDATDAAEWRHSGHETCLAQMLELAGEPEKALPVWRALSQKFPAQRGNQYGDRAHQALQRLQSGRQ